MIGFVIEGLVGLVSREKERRWFQKDEVYSVGDLTCAGENILA